MDRGSFPWIPSSIINPVEVLGVASLTLEERKESEVKERCPFPLRNCHNLHFTEKQG
jgi:hypothetical protein